MATDSKNPQQPGGKPQYDEERPGYDVDVETEVPPGRKGASEKDQPGAGKSGMGWGQDQRQRPEVGEPDKRPPSERPDEERQTKKRP